MLDSHTGDFVLSTGEALGRGRALAALLASPLGARGTITPANATPWRQWVATDAASSDAASSDAASSDAASSDAASSRTTWHITATFDSSSINVRYADITVSDRG